MLYAVICLIERGDDVGRNHIANIMPMRMTMYNARTDCKAEGVAAMKDEVLNVLR